MLCLLLGYSGLVKSADSLTPLELQGRQIYQQGQDGSNVTINVTLGLSNTSLSATRFACANCHGAEGEGKVEGNLRIPPITASSLLATTSRAAYDDHRLAQAISTGKSANSLPLDAAMPSYTMTKPQMTALLAYLKRLGSAIDVDPGINQDAIQLGSVLPLTGALQATGTLLKATLDACVAEVNAQGLIYGRHLSIVTADSASTGDGAATATQRLLAENNTFALLARYADDSEMNPSRAESLVPDIAPITFMPKAQTTADAARFYFLPSYVDQARALVDYGVRLPEFTQLKSKSALALIVGEQAVDKLTAERVRQQAKMHGLIIESAVYWQTGKIKPAVKALLAKKPAALFFLGNMQELRALNTLLLQTPQRPILFSLMAMLGREVLQLPNLAFSQVFLATPFADNAVAAQQLTARLKPYAVALQNPSLQSVMCAAVDVVVEGLKRSGRQLSRLKFLAALEGLRNFPASFLPPLNFSPNSKIGVQGAYILGINQQGEQISQSVWITPANAEPTKP
ncbi:MAG: ABC transporter substrate-binding protein [Methylococcaceae bacterium]|nr:ABC transporter substrate-binding protein [Methylococcaceae bacterium]